MAIVKNKAATAAKEEAPAKADAPKAATKATTKKVEVKEPATTAVKAEAAPAKEVVARVTRKDIAAAIQEKVKAAGKAVPASIAEIMVVAYEEVVTEALASGAQVTLPGFGTFTAVAKDAMERPNPQKPGEKILVAAHVAPKFKAGSGLKKALNADGVEGDGEDE